MLSSVLVLRAAPSLPQPYPARHQQAPGLYSSPCHSARHHARPLVRLACNAPLSPAGSPARHANRDVHLQLCHASTSGRDTPQLKATLFKTVTRWGRCCRGTGAHLPALTHVTVAPQVEQCRGGGRCSSDAAAAPAGAAAGGGQPHSGPCQVATDQWQVHRPMQGWSTAAVEATTMQHRDGLP
jgi:hypothetical protein